MRCQYFISEFRFLHTHNAILHTKTQLVFEVWPLNENCGYRRAAHDVELHLHLILQALIEMYKTYM